MRTARHLAATLLVIGIAACAAESGSSLEGSGDGPSGGTGAANGSSGAGEFNPTTGSGSGSGGFEACATASEEATLVPVNMYLAVDKSGSMDDNNKWNNARAAFNSFFQDPQADSLRVALRFWPDQGCDSSCQVQPCATPQVPLGSLKDAAQEQALVGLFNAKSPDGNTPMSAALAGATSWAAGHQMQTEGKEKTVAVLVTDGEPTACDENITSIAAIAQQAYQQSGVLTFAVGLQGSNEQQMHQIAQAGGTTKGYFIGAANAQAELLAALKQIQQSILACSFAMPESTDPNKPISPTLVNITFTPSDGSGPQTLEQVQGESQCGPDGGWYYDDPNNPSLLSLCDASCDFVQSDESGKIEIVLGCNTVAK